MTNDIDTFILELAEGVSCTFVPKPLFPDDDDHHHHHHHHGDSGIIEYRHGNSPIFYPIKMPGLGKVGNTVITEPVFVSSPAVKEWLADFKSGNLEPTTMYVRNHYDRDANTVWELGDVIAVIVDGHKTDPASDSIELKKIVIDFKIIKITAP